jgi:hypothetical protein
MACLTVHHWDPVEAGLAELRRMVARLADALRSGAWDAEHGHLRSQREFDGALRLVVSEAA